MTIELKSDWEQSLSMFFNIPEIEIESGTCQCLWVNTCPKSQ